jgi:hypothetical protein
METLLEVFPQLSITKFIFTSRFESELDFSELIFPKTLTEVYCNTKITPSEGIKHYVSYCVSGLHPQCSWTLVEDMIISGEYNEPTCPKCIKFKMAREKFGDIPKIMDPETEFRKTFIQKINPDNRLSSKKVNKQLRNIWKEHKKYYEELANSSNANFEESYNEYLAKIEEISI